MIDLFFDIPAVHARIAGRSDAGRRRSENQDCFLVADLAPDAATRSGLGHGALAVQEGGSALLPVGPRGMLALVADGMGGAAGGSVASRMAAESILESLRASWSHDGNHAPLNFATRLRAALEDANARVYAAAAADAALAGMGTTVTAVGVLGAFLYLAQVGDSRAYLVRDGEITQLTRDQSLLQKMAEAGMVDDLEAAEARGVGNMILQALGALPAVEVDLTYLEARRNDVLVVCSDGLYRVIRPAELSAYTAQVPDPDSLCEALVDLANDRGAPDNVTVVVARLDGEGLALPGPGVPTAAPVPHG